MLCVCHVNTKSDFYFSLEFLQNKLILGYSLVFQIYFLNEDYKKIQGYIAQSHGH